MTRPLAPAHALATGPLAHWTDAADVAGAVFMLAGALLCLLAGIGLVRLPDVPTRIHAATKPQSFGLTLVLIGAGLWLRSPIDLGTMLLVGLFQLLTTPVAAHMVGRAAYRTGRVDRDGLVADDLAEARAEQQRKEAEQRGEAPEETGGGNGTGDAAEGDGRSGGPER
ncbi:MULTISPECIES: monovalent cation/H(+) antiporter subunit G [Streptomyces]|uniref:monovalent cation/H(+) antiporter subunit G n=1 Tax=Streptomyces TaxID=1883 RepID=UPI00099CB617|nr:MULTISPECIES: monovalent cation/H(+) antiporter subunit G [Streptomyces]